MENKTQLKPITKKSIVDQIIDRIIAAVSKGEYKAGARLPSEYELMEELNVSRNSLREGLKILESMGIIEIKRGDGTYVCSQINPSAFDTMVYSMIFDISTSEELIELRQILDESMIRLAIKKASTEDIASLQHNVDEFKQCLIDKETKLAAKLDYQFHMTLLNLTKNVFLIRITKGIYKLYVDSIEKNILVEDKFANADMFHQQIIDCIKNKNVDDIGRVVSESLSSWKKNIIR